MILIDTHMWIWWIHDDPRLTARQREILEQHETDDLAASIMSCWEVAKLVERHRLVLPEPVDRWLELALGYPGVQMLPLTPEIAVESTRLPGSFHRDPVDQILVASARICRCPILTADQQILGYAHVERCA